MCFVLRVLYVLPSGVINDVCTHDATTFYLMTLLTPGANITFLSRCSNCDGFPGRMTRVAHHSSRATLHHISQSSAAANLSHTAHAARRRSSACNKYENTRGATTTVRHAGPVPELRWAVGHGHSNILCRRATHTHTHTHAHAFTPGRLFWPTCTVCTHHPVFGINFMIFVSLVVTSYMNTEKSFSVALRLRDWLRSRNRLAAAAAAAVVVVVVVAVNCVHKCRKIKYQHIQIG